MTEIEKRSHRCCFTGHRPEKLQSPEFLIKLKLGLAIRKAIKDGYVTFITGMARGVDLWAAEIVIDLRKSNPAIHLISAIPFPGFEKNWSSEDRADYMDIMRQADIVRFISKKYSRGVFQIRNEWMVDHCRRIIAVYNGSAGGTQNTLVYASKILDIEVIQITG